jgi:hypothetical protein
LRARWIALGAGLWLAAACAPTDPLVARGGDWRITRTQLAAEYDRIYGPRSYERAQPERRARFLETAVHKQLLLDEAHRAVPRLSARDERRVRVRAAEQLLDEYRQTLWKRALPDSTRLSQAEARLAREVHAWAIVTPTRGAADACHAALLAGLSFEDAWKRFGGRLPDGQTMDQGWRDPLWFPPRVMRAIYLEDLAPGAFTAPIATRRGNWIARAVEYRPFDLTARAGYQGRARGLLKRMLYRDDRMAARDSLERAMGYRLFPEACEPVARAVRAYLDSVSASHGPGTHADPWSVRAPYWRLSGARALAVLDGETLTTVSFVRSLDSIDVRNWPRRLYGTRPVSDVGDAMLARILAIDAHRRGIDASPAYREAVERLRDDALLDEYHDDVVLPEISVTPAEVDSLYAANPERWTVPERVEFSAVIFPAEENEAAHEFLEAARGGDAYQWLDLAQNAAETVEGVEYIDTSDMLELGRTPEPPSWLPMLAAAAALPVGGIMGPVPVPELGGSAIVRLIDRLPASPLPPASARVMAGGEARLLKVEGKLARILEEARRREGVRTWPDRLAPRGTAGR